MAGLSVVIRVTVTHHTRESLTARLTDLISEHREHCGREGIVPAVLAEDMAERLITRGDVVLIREEVT